MTVIKNSFQHSYRCVPTVNHLILVDHLLHRQRIPAIMSAFTKANPDPAAASVSHSLDHG
jgi:hypothetical protein